MKQSAGILLYRNSENGIEFFLVHPGGPFFAKKHEGWWTIPKGELLPDELQLDCAIREFEEETGYKPSAPFTPLQPVTQKGGKQVLAFAAEGDLNPETITSNAFSIEWPPKSGKMKDFPEVDKAGWYSLAAAKVLINERQVALLEEVVGLLGY